MLTLLNMHLQMVHPNTNAPAPAAAASVRPDRLPRPTFSLNMSEAAWDYGPSVGQVHPAGPHISSDETQPVGCCSWVLRVFDSDDYM